MKTILSLILLPIIFYAAIFTAMGFLSLIIAPNVNSAYWGMTIEPYFFGIHNTLFFLLIAVPVWTAIYFLYKFYKKFDWNNDLVYLYLKTITKKTSSNIDRTKDKLRQDLDSTKDKLRQDIDSSLDDTNNN